MSHPHAETQDLHARVAKHLGWTPEEARSFSFPTLAAMVQDETLRRDLQAHIRSQAVIVGEPQTAVHPKRTSTPRGHRHVPTIPADDVPPPLSRPPANRLRDKLYDLFRAVPTTNAGPCARSPKGLWSTPVEIPVELLAPLCRGKAIPHIENRETGEERLERLRKSRGTWKPIEVGFAPGCMPYILDGNHRILVALERGDATITAQATFAEKPWWPCTPIEGARSSNPKGLSAAEVYFAGDKMLTIPAREVLVGDVLQVVTLDRRTHKVSHVEWHRVTSVDVAKDVTIRWGEMKVGVVDVASSTVKHPAEAVTVKRPSRAHNPVHEHDEVAEGDPRRCPVHGTVISSADGLHDGVCGACEAMMDDDDEDLDLADRGPAEPTVQPPVFSDWDQRDLAACEPCSAPAPNRKRNPAKARSIRKSKPGVEVEVLHTSRAVEVRVGKLPSSKRAQILQASKAMKRAKMLRSYEILPKSASPWTLLFKCPNEESAKHIVQAVGADRVAAALKTERKPNPVLPAVGKLDKKAPSAPDRVGKPRAR